MPGHNESVTLGVWVTLAGALITLGGAAKGLGVHGGAWALLPAGFHERRRELGRWVKARFSHLQRWVRSVFRRPQVLAEEPASPSTVSLRYEFPSTVHTPTFPDISADSAGFASTVYEHVDRLSLDLSVVQGDLAQERVDREAAIKAARTDLTAAAAEVLEHSKTVELSGIRWQVFGAAVVVLGVVLDSVWG